LIVVIVLTHRTTITILDENLWKWAKKRTIDLDLKNISQYLFELIRKDRDGEIRWKHV